MVARQTYASLGQHREGGIILLGSIGSTPEIEFLSPIPALVPIRPVFAGLVLEWG